MTKLMDDVKGLFESATSQERRFFMKAPSLSSIEKGLDNFEKFSADGKIVGRRMIMGQVGMVDGHVVGYNSFVVMDNARATPYERKNMDMGNGLDYVWAKKLFVHPDFRGQGIGIEFVENVLNLSGKLGKHCILDLDVENYLMGNILSQYEFSQDFNWSAPDGRKMTRFYHD